MTKQNLNTLLHGVCRQVVMVLLFSVPFCNSGVTAASCLGPAADYNVFVLNNLNLIHSDAQGNVAVGGIATLANFKAGSGLGSSAQLVVGTSLNAQDGTVGNPDTGEFGTIYAPTGTDIPPSVNYGSLQNNPGSVVDFNSATTFLQHTSTYWSGLPVNGSTDLMYGNNLWLTTESESPGLYVFEVPGDWVTVASVIKIDVPRGSTVLANISGSHISFTNAGYNIVDNAVGPTDILYNFHAATELAFQNVGIQGSVLAPMATVKFSTGNIDGQMIANNILPDAGLQTGEFHHDFTFDGDLPTAPIPGTVLLLGSGLVGLVEIKRRRRLSS